jgi:hypothetical protein
MNQSLSPKQVNQFHQQGYLIIEKFYDLSAQIEPIQKAIFDIIGVCLKKHNIDKENRVFSAEHFDWGYQQLIELDRNIGGVIYDAVKQIPAFQRLISCQQNEELFKQIRNTCLAGIASGGSGIRIDNPNEAQYEAPWHQEFPAQLRSLDGLILWSPLRPLYSQLGPVEICPASHLGGLIPVYSDSYTSGKSGAYALRLQDEEDLIGRYSKVSPLLNPGDVVVMDWLVLHRSGKNSSHESRWTMQMRYFSFKEETGISIDWKGSFASGSDFRELFPELIAKRKDLK